MPDCDGLPWTTRRASLPRFDELRALSSPVPYRRTWRRPTPGVVSGPRPYGFEDGFVTHQTHAIGEIAVVVIHVSIGDSI
jgi:hypothetical protein